MSNFSYGFIHCTVYDYASHSFFFPKVGDINSSNLLVFSHFYEKETIFVTLFASVGKHAFPKWGLV